MEWNLNIAKVIAGSFVTKIKLKCEECCEASLRKIYWNTIEEDANKRRRLRLISFIYGDLIAQNLWRREAITSCTLRYHHHHNGRSWNTATRPEV